MRFLSIIIILIGLSWTLDASESYEKPDYEPVIQKSPEERIEALAAAHNVDADLAKRIIWCESRGEPYAVNSDTGDHGFFQINGVWEEELRERGWRYKTNPQHNLEAGFYILSEYGAHHWNASKECWGK